MNPPAIEPVLAPLLAQWLGGTWYEQQALQSVLRGWYRTVLGDDGSLYLLRCWMVQPKPDPTDDEKFESGNSVLLHFFPRPDLDRALHDHPWDFTTTILSGGYTEALPPDTWPGRLQGFGPEVHTWLLHNRNDGDTIERKAEDLHLIRSLQHTDCWTMVRTGERRRDWGFHPPGKPWIAFKDWTAAKAAAPKQVA